MQFVKLQKFFCYLLLLVLKPTRGSTGCYIVNLSKNALPYVLRSSTKIGSVTILSIFFLLWGHCDLGLRSRSWLVMGDRLNFIIDHRLESVDAFDAILPIIIGSLIFTKLSTFYALEGNSGACVFFPLSVCNNWFSYITLGKTYCQSLRRL